MGFVKALVLILSQPYGICILAWKLIVTEIMIEVWSVICQRDAKNISHSSTLQKRGTVLVLVGLGFCIH